MVWAGIPTETKVPVMDIYDECSYCRKGSHGNLSFAAGQLLTVQLCKTVSIWLTELPVHS